MGFVYLDFEYQADELKEPGKELRYKDNTNPDRLLLVTVSQGNEEPAAFDLRDKEQRELFCAFYKETFDCTYVSFNVSAEVNCCLSLGLDVRDRDWIDLSAEAKMLMLTNSQYFSSAMGLVDACRVFGVKLKTSPTAKDLMRNIILSKRSYTAEEWEKIVAYGLEDTACLCELHKAIFVANRQHYLLGRTHFEPTQFRKESVERGNYCRDAAVMFRRSLGLPVDVERMKRVYGNLHLVRKHLAEGLNELVPDLFVFKQTKKGLQITMSSKAFQSHIDDLVELNELQGRWETTATSLYKTDDETLKAFLKPTDPTLYAELMFYKSLKSVNFLDLVEDGYVHPVNYPFAQKTGRSSPKPTQGYILAADKWVRCFVRPKPGMVVIGADWSSQEIFIAAAMSGDKALMGAYKSGDVYLSLAKMAGDVPQDGNREDYEHERQMYKAVQLGLAYGKGARSLAQELYLSAKLAGKELTQADAVAKAKAIVDWHKETFASYWKYVNAISRIPKSLHKFGIYKTVNNDWTYFIDGRSKTTALQNAPMQANGASVMRTAFVLCLEAGLDVACTQHDALYVNSTEADAEFSAELLKECMCEAVRIVFGHLTDEITRVDVEIFSDANPYFKHQPKGYALLQRIESIIEKEIENV
jgi:DNA polymerase-1